MNDSFSNITTFDSLVQTQQLQIIKAAIPYIQTSEQKFLSIYVKFLELNQTIHLFNKKDNALKACSVDTETESPTELPIRMLNDVRCYCTDSEKETIDMILNFFSAFELYRSYLDTPEAKSTRNENPFSFIKNFLSPEQKEIFETYQAQST